MSFLLDTHAYLWWALDDSRLSNQVRRVLEDAAHDVFLSAASVWEIAIKVALGKLILKAPLTRAVIDEPSRIGLSSLAVSPVHACRTAELPLLHRDPFDRILVAQAQVEDLVLLTKDPMITKYAVPTMW